MKLSISNIAWDSKDDIYIYEICKKLGYFGIEIAPTKSLGENPYGKPGIAVDFYEYLNKKFDLGISSMQSIWYGRVENLFDSQETMEIYNSYTKLAIDTAKMLKCDNLVLGSPRNRNRTGLFNDDEIIKYFRELGDYAAESNTILSIEANPAIYNTNFINYTSQAIEMVKKVNSKGFKLNLDIGTMIVNEEVLSIVEADLDLVNHIHISEPYLEMIEKREIHRELAVLLKKLNYKNCVSIEMKRRENIDEVVDTMIYVKELFHG